MDKLRIQKIEKQALSEEYTEALGEAALRVAYEGLANPEFYSLELSDNNKRAIVRRKIDNAVVYFTDRPEEIEELKMAGLNK